MFQGLPDTIRGAVRDLSETAGDTISYDEIQPTDREAEEAVSRQFGARPMALGLLSDETFYLYGLLQVGDRIESIPLVSGDLTQAQVREMVEAALRRQTPGLVSSGIP